MSSALVVADEGCCAGHLCDQCVWCRKGQCCRQDNPGYRLPTLGDWDGPIYGQLGQREIIGDTITCHICGESYRALGRHVWAKHNVTAEEYKHLFGLSTRGLVAPVTREKLQKKTPEQLVRLQAQLPVLTPEQLSAYTRGRPTAIEVRQKLTGGGRVEVTCVICGATVQRWRCKLQRHQPVCSPACQQVLLHGVATRSRGGRVSFICPVCGTAAEAYRSSIERTRTPTCRDPACTREVLRRQGIERQKHTRKGRRRAHHVIR